MVAIFLSSVSVYKNSCCFYIVKKAAALLRQPGQSKKLIILFIVSSAANSHGCFQGGGHTVCEFNELTGTDRYSCQRIFRDHGGNAGLFLDQGIQTTEKGATAGHYDTTVKNIGCQFWWCSLQNIVYSIYNLESRFS